MRLGSWTRRAVLSNLAVGPFLPSWLDPREAYLLREIAHRNEGVSLQQRRGGSFESIVSAVGDADTVLLGEATHGTEEFYRVRSDLTKELLRGGDFDAVLCEGDVAPFFDLNRYVCGGGDKTTTLQEAFANFDRFPTWMWRNDAFAEFVAWLDEFNEHRSQPVQLLGLDIYSLYQSMDQVVGFLDGIGETELARTVLENYSAIDHFRPDATDYGKAAFYNAAPSQERSIRRALKQLQRQEGRLRESSDNPQEVWRALENSHTVAASELFHRQLLVSREQHTDGMLWNIREAAMFRALQSARSHLEQEKGRPARVIVWAHNSHVGDARSSGHAKRGRGPPHFNLGQLCRQVLGDSNVYTVGLTCNEGTVRAVREWGEADKVAKLLPAFEGSHEYLLGRLASAKRRNVMGYCLRNNRDPTRVDSAARELFSIPRLQRFVGVSYVPETELQSHYSTSNLSEGFDYVIHVDRSTAVKVDKVSRWKPDRGAVAQEPSMYLLDAFGGGLARDH